LQLYDDFSSVTGEKQQSRGQNFCLGASNFETRPIWALPKLKNCTNGIQLVLSWGSCCVGVAVTTTPSVDGRGGGLQEMSCLPLEFLPGWLFGVSASRVKDDLREKIIRYQRESYDVLWKTFKCGRGA